MINFDEQVELTSLLDKHDFQLISVDERHLDFSLDKPGKTVEIHIITNLLQPLITIKVNGENEVLKMPDSFDELKTLLQDFLDKFDR